jgi:hypothetical protein
MGVFPIPGVILGGINTVPVSTSIQVMMVESFVFAIEERSGLKNCGVLRIPSNTPRSRFQDNIKGEKVGHDLRSRGMAETLYTIQSKCAV